MRFIPVVFLLLGFLPSLAGAANYACRDSQGKLYFGDNPLSFPDDCRQNLHQIEQKSYSDSSAVPPADNTESTMQAEGSKDQIKQNEGNEQLTAELRQRAAGSAEKYAQGIQGREEAEKRRAYGSRTRFAETKKMIDDAEQLIGEARKEKKQLLEDLESQNISEQQRAEIENLLDPIQ